MSKAARDSEIPAGHEPTISPYVGGGGGTTFGHQVAAVYMSGFLLGDGRPETDDLPITRVAFQTNPQHTVDDLLVVAGTGGDELRIRVAIRRLPNFAKGHVKTRALVASLMREVETSWGDKRARVAVAVAMPKQEYNEVQILATLARENADESVFFAQIHTPGRWDAGVPRRYGHLRQLVADGRPTALSEDEGRRLTWQLLTRLWILPFRVEVADQSDWSHVANSMNRVARKHRTGVDLRERIFAYCVQDDLLGVEVDSGGLRRFMHTVLDASAIRHQPGWAALAEMKRHSYNAVRDTIGPDHDDPTPVTIGRADLRIELTAALISAGTGVGAIIVTGESGTGKSALVLSVVAALEAEDPEPLETLVVNLRRLPRSAPELANMLGRSVREFLIDLSAPSRALVIDGADAAIEGQATLLAELATEAHQAGVGLVVVSADTAASLVIDQVKHSYRDAHEFKVLPLNDTEIAAIAARVPQLAGLLRALPAQSLLRRLVVLDLLSRTGLLLTAAMTDWDCLEVVWKGLVRRNENTAFGSAEGRENALLALAEAEIGLPPGERRYGPPDAAAVDALRRDHLLGPASIWDQRPQFAHDEVRRYATALALFRSGDITRLLDSAGVPRWTMSAAQLACLGQFIHAGGPNVTFAEAVKAFVAIGARYGVRWADVPIEAALQSPHAFEHLKALRPDASGVSVETLLRVLEQRHLVNGLLDIARGEAVVRVLLQHDEPWLLSQRSFETIASWLQSLVMAETPPGNATRLRLRNALWTYWSAHYRAPASESADPETTRVATRNSVARRWGQRDRHRAFTYKLRERKYVELLALLGNDIDDNIEGCLKHLADSAPESLAAAVDAPFGARAIGQHDVELLIELVEAYYIDDSPRANPHAGGIRRHQGRWYSLPLFSAYHHGAFWQLFQYLDPIRSAALLNKILNHAARSHVEQLSGRGDYGLAPDRTDIQRYTATLHISGEARPYIGDADVWAWYQGSSVGPYPCMSALQAMERVLDQWVAIGTPLSAVATMLLNGCENLAVPALLVGILVRHLEKAGSVIDSFLREPLVWDLEFGRVAHLQAGLRIAPSDGIVNAERRTWNFHKVAMTLVMASTQSRRDELVRLGQELIANGEAVDMGEEAATWASSLDHSRFQARSDGRHHLVEVMPPSEQAESHAESERSQQRNLNVLRILNRYWAQPQRPSSRYIPPTALEIASDLAQARELMESVDYQASANALRGTAHAAAAAIRCAAGGAPAAFGDETAFAIDLIMAIARSYDDGDDEDVEERHFDFGAANSAVSALPYLLLPPLGGALAEAGFTEADIRHAAFTVANKGSLEMRLHLARGTDPLWQAPCTQTPCIHTVALDWITDTARNAEIGPWDTEGQTRSLVRIDGDLAARLAELDGNSIDLRLLDAAIRGHGSAASAECCMSELASTRLPKIINAQRIGMLTQDEADFSSVDPHGSQSLVTARALLQNSAMGTYTQAITDHMTALAGNAQLLANFLHALAAAGAETPKLAHNASGVWPTVMKHGLTFTQAHLNPFEDHNWGKWALAALIPSPPVWTDGLYNELTTAPIDWVVPYDLLDIMPNWVIHAYGDRRCLDDLISIIRKLNPDEQVDLGLQWVIDVCIRDAAVGVYRAFTLAEWLIELRPNTETRRQLHKWQTLVDLLVAAGNEPLAPYSV